MSPPKPQPPRAVLTSLINALTTTPRDPDTVATSENALKSLPHSHRPLLVTLHVLFPSIVLPALDLLDRDLVARVVRDDTDAADIDLDGEDPAGDHRPGGPDQDAEEDRGGGERATGSDRREAASFYVVRSVASTMSRRRKTDADPAAVNSAGTKYLVHLDAWNCTCANFAFEAFPPPGGGEDEIEILGADAEDLDEAVPSSPEWQFGGLSLDGMGMDRGGVPCCKHLLACLLAEQWGSVLGRYVTERRMSRAAIAGTVGDM